MQNGWAFSGATATKAQAHRRRCMSLPPLQAGEAERLMAEFLATRGVSVCPRLPHPLCATNRTVVAGWVARAVCSLRVPFGRCYAPRHNAENGPS
jgi:hypothetical protein